MDLESSTGPGQDTTGPGMTAVSSSSATTAEEDDDTAAVVAKDVDATATAVVVEVASACATTGETTDWTVDRHTHARCSEVHKNKRRKERVLVYRTYLLTN